MVKGEVSYKISTTIDLAVYFVDPNFL